MQFEDNVPTCLHAEVLTQNLLRDLLFEETNMKGNPTVGVYDNNLKQQDKKKLNSTESEIDEKGLVECGIDGHISSSQGF